MSLRGRAARTSGGLPQFKETSGQKPSPKSIDQAGIDGTTKVAWAPADAGDRISYGIITDVNFANYQVKVRVLGNRRHAKLENEWQSLITQQDEIFLRWGQLRKGMYCRIHWRGAIEAKYGFIEIIGDEETNLLKQSDKKNEVKTFPYKFLGGGLTAF